MVNGLTISGADDASKLPLWQGFWIRAFGNMAPRLADVLKANGCREGWVQGEFFRLAGKYAAPCLLHVNTRPPSGSRGAFDLSSDGSHPMIAEIKIVGGGYLRKNINGYHGLLDLPQGWTLTGCTGQASRNEIRFNAAEGSIFKDLSRLWNEPWDKAQPRQRHMIVVVPDDHVDTNIGPILTSMSFVGEEVNVRFPGFLVRLWHLGEQ
jgi:hypothetical protein